MVYIPWKSHLMSHLNTSAISCAVQPTASRPAHMAPALLPAKHLMSFNIPLSSSAYTFSSRRNIANRLKFHLKLYTKYWFITAKIVSGDSVQQNYSVFSEAGAIKY